MNQTAAAWNPPPEATKNRDWPQVGQPTGCLFEPLRLRLVRWDQVLSQERSHIPHEKGHFWVYDFPNFPLVICFLVPWRVMLDLKLYVKWGQMIILHDISLTWISPKWRGISIWRGKKQGWNLTNLDFAWFHWNSMEIAYHSRYILKGVRGTGGQTSSLGFPAPGFFIPPVLHWLPTEESMGCQQDPYATFHV